MLVIFSYLQWFMSEFYLVWSIWKEGNGIGPIYVHLTWGLVCLLFLLLSIPLYQTWNRKISFGKNYILEYLYRVCLHGVTMHKSDHESNGGSKVTSLRNYLTTYIYPGSGWSETAVLIKLPVDPVKKVSRVISTSFGCQNNPYSCYLGWTLLGRNQMRHCRGPFNCFDETYLSHMFGLCYLGFFLLDCLCLVHQLF
jgi:hypothetical protein